MKKALKRKIILIITIVLIVSVLAALCLNADAIKFGAQGTGDAVSAHNTFLRQDGSGNLIFADSLAEDGYIYKEDGTQSEGNYKSMRFEKGVLDFKNKKYMINEACYITFWDNDGSFINGYAINTASSDNPAEVSAPVSNYDHIIIGLLHADTQMYGLDKNALNADFKNRFKESLPNLYRLENTVINSELIDSYTLSGYGNLIDGRKLSEGAAINTDGVEKEGGSLFETAAIKLEEKTEYMFNFPTVAVFYDKDKNFISGYEDSAARRESPQVLTVPKNAAYVRFSLTAGDKKHAVFSRRDCFENELPTLYTIGPVGESATYQAKKDGNPLYGKTAVFFGDSLCYGRGDAAGGWAGWIQRNNQSMNVINCGVSGYTFDMSSVKWFDGGVNQKSLPDDSDYVIIQGFTNGMYTAKPKKPLGKINENDYTVTIQNCDTSTYSGEMEKFILQCIDRWNGKKLGFIISFKAVAHLDAKNPYRQFTPQMLAVCRKYSIPVLNLQEESTIPCFTQEYIDAYFRIPAGSLHGDGIHLNAKGNAIISAKIEAWMKTL